MGFRAYSVFLPRLQREVQRLSSVVEEQKIRDIFPGKMSSGVATFEHEIWRSQICIGPEIWLNLDSSKRAVAVSGVAAAGTQLGACSVAYALAAIHTVLPASELVVAFAMNWR